MRWLVAVAVVLLLCTNSAVAQPVGTLVPPVDGAVVRHFDPPANEYGPGHRGVDYRVPPGTRVRAAGAGVVTFAGEVAGVRAVTVDHGGGMETTYSDLGVVSVAEGQTIQAGTWLGAASIAHQGTAGLHFGVKLDGVYVDPAVLLTPADLGGALRLAPLLWEPSSAFPEPLALALAPRGPGSHEQICVDAGTRSSVRLPPNDNVAIAVAGITSKTRGRDSADMYNPGPAFFGYPSERTYRFSYRGSDDTDLHEDYERTDTYGDLDVAAARLGRLVNEVGRRHPGAGIDLIAHSQGGIVARSYLASHAEGDPRVEHLVTLASPHTGAPAAEIVPHLRDRTITGPALLNVAHAAAKAELPVPDPRSPAVEQLAPSSGLMQGLARRDVAYGVRSLSLGITNDLVVPADRSSMPGSLHRVVPPLGGASGHSAIVTSEVTRTIVYDFLRGAPEPCRSGWDEVGPRVGRAVSAAESHLGAAVSAVEGPVGRILSAAVGLVAGRR